MLGRTPPTSIGRGIAFASFSMFFGSSMEATFAFSFSLESAGASSLESAGESSLDAAFSIYGGGSPLFIWERCCTG